MISTFPAQGSTGFQSFLRCSVLLKITCWKHSVSRLALSGSSKSGMVKRTHPKICFYKILLTLRMKMMYPAETQIWITTPQFFITQFVEQTLKQMPCVRVPEFVFWLWIFSCFNCDYNCDGHCQSSQLSYWTVMRLKGTVRFQFTLKCLSLGFAKLMYYQL